MSSLVLTVADTEAYRVNGYCFVDNALAPTQLEALRTDFAAWVDESRAHTEPYGQTPDGRSRFDLEVDHAPERPALRRVASPVDVSDAYLEVMRDNRALDAVTQLIGPNVVPGSHRGPLFDHWHDGVYTGTVSPEVEAAHGADALSVQGPAGSACLMHTRLLHGSAPNRSSQPRTLFISEYRAEDSKALQVNHLPSIHDGEVVRGERTNRVRCSTYEMEYPEVPTGASFFSQQAKADGLSV
ncbi:MAG: phytanoyl-CoA dioxygenase family protein [Actinomycetia bacterium]|nr:phytanoyl-CoA dioxygenase family protein [Actinomycetes bacterium]